MENLKASRDELDQIRIEYELKITECDQLASMMGMTMVYITNINCPIDRVLGDFINSHHERFTFKVLFKRESEGLYNFGSKRVTVKIEKGNQILVRVGGGYMKI